MRNDLHITSHTLVFRTVFPYFFSFCSIRLIFFRSRFVAAATMGVRFVIFALRIFIFNEPNAAVSKNIRFHLFGVCAFRIGVLDQIH